MGQIVEVLGSPLWWVSVVLAGILINLAAAYLKPVVDSRLSVASSWWAERAVLQLKAQQEKLRKLSESFDEQVMTSIEALRLLLLAIIAIAGGIFVMLFGRELLTMLLGDSASTMIEVIRNTIAAGCLFVSFLFLRQAAGLRHLLEKAAKNA